MDMCGLFQSCPSFQNAHQASDFRLLRSLEPDATMEPRYLNLIHGWLDLHRLEGLAEGCNSQESYTLSLVHWWQGQGQLLLLLFWSALPDMRWPHTSSFWVLRNECLVQGQLGLCSRDWGSSKAMSSAKSRSFNDLAGCRLERRGWVTTPESSWDVAFFSR